VAPPAPATAQEPAVVPDALPPSILARPLAEPVGADDRLLAWGLALATFLLMWSTQRPIGYMRDEGYYFTAAQSYEEWFVELGRDFSDGHFAQPFTDAAINRHWSYNSEHPVLIKTFFALSHLLFHRGLGWMDDATAYRFPAFIISGLLSWALFWLTRPAGRLAAVLAPLLFWAVPRHAFHGHLACFDLPVVATWCFFFLMYARSIEEGRGAWKAGAAFGLALATKHNALFLPIVVVLHWIITDGHNILRAGWRGFFRRIPRAVWAMLILGPTILYLHWPYLWHHPIDHTGAWIGFHLAHVNYSWQYFGKVLREPPFPHAYPVMLELLTIPAATLAVMIIGSALIGARWLAPVITPLRGVVGRATSRDWLIGLGAIVAIAPFTTGHVPIFGGIKHWMSAPALACIFGAEAIAVLGRALRPERATSAGLALGALVLLPGAWATSHFLPYGTSAYNEAAGGAAGGAALGMQRQYWSNNVTSVLRWLNEHAPPHAAVFFHEVNIESYRAYQANGQLRSDIHYAPSQTQASIAVYQYHQEFRDREFDIWTEFGTRTPALTFTIDEAPQIVVYARPGAIR
jgi:hypothetical protein